ncbi:tRNA cyclic N6-threonylcarbamoyladenosine(37) synthase TcdA [Pantoea sp. Mhis]|uniref:tRNA cyclic N6-threonylcarbamoyladenosine(37) synthase TcdA n=1 Tax=Pantoea sp. Mhis TaxID=2576759 RepID=UPI001356A1C5|nr:tRNA cyclic N6-threonylcarbamoyladenosine(37) synthase TcdA [Pantoea sp. Mhis]MXP56726.1 tRNA cyclic N6-threonylcarbamoyladenosine(37) synthase TcdA [Pantoea sp. Mhis]
MVSNAWWQRFNGVSRLYGEDSLQYFANAHFCVIGIGGVGSWVVEALVRTGIGKITLIDMDDICISNTNRQVQVLQHKIGKEKVEVMAERIMDINPECNVICINKFITPNNAPELLSVGYNYIIDAIDNIEVKAFIISYCYLNKIPLVTIGGAGGKIDPTQIKIDDLMNTFQDPLIACLRNKLKAKFSISKVNKNKLGIDCVFSTEKTIYPKLDGPKRLDCRSGFGTVTMVTATFGFLAVSHTLKKILIK